MVQKDLISTTYVVGFLSFSPVYFALFEKVKKQMRFDGICLPSIINQHFMITKKTLKLLIKLVLLNCLNRKKRHFLFVYKT